MIQKNKEDMLLFAEEKKILFIFWQRAMGHILILIIAPIAVKNYNRIKSGFRAGRKVNYDKKESG